MPLLRIQLLNMSLSALTKFLIPPVIASAAVFSAMSTPLFLLGSEQVNIKFKEEPFFYGKLRDIATPYVVLATAISLGAGLSATAVCGWRNSSRKSTKFEQQLSVLEKNLQEKEDLLKELKLSETRLQASGLNTFLDDEASDRSSNHSHIPATKVSQPVVVQTKMPLQPPVDRETVSAVGATSGFASAQTFHGYAQANINGTKETATASNVNKTSEFEELQKQLREMMLQMQAMQNNLQQITPAKNAEAEVPDKLKVFYDSPNTYQVQLT